MKEPLHNVDEFAETIKEYISVRTSQTKLHFAEKSAKLLSIIISSSFVFLFFLVFVFFLLLACSIIIGKILGGFEWGLLAVGGFSLFLSLILKWSRKKIFEYPLMNVFLQHILNDDDKN